jgi:hypothetical protein
VDQSGGQTSSGKIEVYNSSGLRIRQDARQLLGEKRLIIVQVRGPERLRDNLWERRG